MAWSRSACCPVRPNRACSAVPRLDSIAGRSGWSAGVASTASRLTGEGLVQVRLLPGAPEPGPQRGPEVGQHRGPVGVVGSGWRRRPRRVG